MTPSRQGSFRTSASSKIREAITTARGRGSPVGQPRGRTDPLEGSSFGRAAAASDSPTQEEQDKKQAVSKSIVHTKRRDPCSGLYALQLILRQLPHMQATAVIKLELHGQLLFVIPHLANALLSCPLTTPAP
ncbi:unnamed protein product, partial [Chrysoparadoxa australica]